MKFKIGDRVKFLDEHGGGIISKIISHNMVHVAIEDGFEIPTLTSNLIREEDMRVPERPQASASAVSPAPAPAEEDSVRSRPLPQLAGRKEMPEGLYLAYLPQDQKWLVTGGYDLFILNHTPWEVIFNLYLERDGGKYVGKDYDVIPARHRIHLASIKADKLESWTAGTLQFLFRKDKTDRILSPVSVDFRIKAYRFLKEGSYLEYAFMEGRSFLLSLMPLTAVGTSGKRAAGGKAEPPVVVKTEEEAELIHSFRTGPLEAEVDLHIGSLVEAANGLSKHEMLTIQAGHFLACLESGLRAGYRKIIFIHGIGAGRLREEITQRLREYDGLSWEDAPMRDYGQGAILVRLPGKGQ